MFLFVFLNKNRTWTLNRSYPLVQEKASDQSKRLAKNLIHSVSCACVYQRERVRYWHEEAAANTSLRCDGCIPRTLASVSSDIKECRSFALREAGGKSGQRRAAGAVIATLLQHQEHGNKTIPLLIALQSDFSIQFQLNRAALVNKQDGSQQNWLKRNIFMQMKEQLWRFIGPMQQFSAFQDY